MALELRDLLSEARQLTAKLAEELEKNNLASDRKKIFQEAFDDLNTKEGTYMKPMLVDQISYLNFTVTGGSDQLPGKDAYDRLAELKKQFQTIKAQVD